MARESFDRLLAALEARGCEPKVSGDSVKARCPSHEDENASFSATYKPDSGRVLVFCHRAEGCEARQIVADLGLTFDDLHDARTHRHEWQVEAAHEYADAAGEIVGVVRRRRCSVCREKEIRPGRPKAGGGFEMKGFPTPPLYRLPQLNEAITAGTTVYLPEGESCVDRLAGLGLVATCNQYGAGKWESRYTESLRGAARVVVVADRDTAGYEHAAKIAAEMVRISVPVEVLRTPVDRKGADIVDHLDAGLTLEQLEPVPAELLGKAPAEGTDTASPVALPAGRDGRSRINTSSVAACADWLREELGRGGLAGLFERDGLLVHTPRIGEEGYIEPTDDQRRAGLRDLGPAQIRPVGSSQVKALIEVRYDVGKNRVDADGQKSWTPTLFPGGAVSSAVDGALIGEGAPNLWRLAGVSHTPSLRPDGSVLSRPGYDEATGLLYLPEPGLDVPPIPDRPTPADVKAAVALVLEPVSEFPFVDEVHRANWVGAMLTPLLRSMLPPPYPLVLIEATNSGSGKGSLAGMIKTAHGGVLRGGLPGDQDELRKLITATLVDTTAPVVIFDNLTGVIRSGVLEALLTSATHTDRYLGATKQVTAANDRLWVATGNNAQVGGDLPRRTLFVSLDPRCENPHLRTGFKLQPLPWMRGHRGAYLAALLTMARAWVLDGMSAEPSRSDDYAAWDGALRGLLSWAGIPGFWGGQTADATRTPDEEQWARFLRALVRTFGEREFTVKALTSRIGDHLVDGIDTEELPGDLAEAFARRTHGADGSFRIKVGWWLKNRAGRFADGMRVTARAHKDGARWRVEVARTGEGGIGGVGGVVAADPARNDPEETEAVSSQPEFRVEFESLGAENSPNSPNSPSLDRSTEPEPALDSGKVTGTGSRFAERPADTSHAAVPAPRRGPGPLPVDQLLHLAVKLPPIECDTCGGTETPVPPANVIYRCARCHPRTLIRDRGQAEIVVAELRELGADAAVDELWAEFDALIA